MKKIFLAGIVLFWALAGYCADFSSFKTDNGQNVIIQEIHDNPIVIIDTWIKTGSINETDENNGVAHFLEHLFFKGTSKHPAKEFDRILESEGAETNAATSKDYTHYYILIPSKYFDTAMELHADMLMNPLIPRKELEKERKVVIEEIAKNNDKPTIQLYRNMIQGFYKTHPYKRDVIGTKNVIETISREQILDFYNTWYIPQNMTTVIIGDVDTQKALSAVKSMFNKPAPANIKSLKQNDYKADKRPSEPFVIKENANIQTSYILVGFKGVHPINSKDSYALDVLATILGEGKSSRLYKNLKEQKQLVHSIGAVHSSMKDDSLFYVSANYNSKDNERIQNAVFDEIDKIKRDEIPAEEIKKAKNIIERETFYGRESVSDIASEIGYTVTLTGDTSYYKNYLENINRVTAADLKRVAKTYLDKEYSVVSILEPEKQSEKVQSGNAVNKDYNAQVVSQNGNTVKYLLENGATLIITQNTANDIIALDMSSKGGNNLEKIPGIASLTADVMKKATQKYSSSELSELREGNGIVMQTSANGDSFGISVKYTKNEKDIALDIFKETVKNALLDNYDIEKAKNDKLTAIKNIKNTPDALAFDEYKTALRQNTPYGNSGKVLEKTLPVIQKSDIDEFYSNLFPAQNTVISINGNVNPQDYINYFSILLENNNTPKIKLEDYKYKYKPLLQNKIVKVAKDSQAAWLLFGWITDGTVNEKDWAALQVINAILGSGMSSRLFTDLRDNMGLAYQVGSTFSASRNSGAFTIYIATNPDSAKTSFDGILAETEKLKKEFVTDKELAEAKEKIIGNYVISVETNMDKASVLNSYEVNERGYEFGSKFPDVINAVTVQDVIKTANKYFSRPYVFTVVGPKNSIEKL